MLVRTLLTTRETGNCARIRAADNATPNPLADAMNCRRFISHLSLDTGSVALGIPLRGRTERMIARVCGNEMSDDGSAGHVGSQPILNRTIRVRHSFVLTQMLRP